jgi:hypothetical protein
MHIDKPIILTEFPKSGGSWVVSMIGDSLNVPSRDIYVRPGFNLFDIKKHPWYRNAEELDFPRQSVIKSHELPDSPLIDFDATYVHLVRDGRDVVVSKWFFDREFSLKNGIITTFENDFDDYIKETAGQWSSYIRAWANRRVIFDYYEKFLESPEKRLGHLLKVMTGHEIDEGKLANTVRKYTKENFSASLDEAFRHNTFVRKGIQGDWRNHFSEKNISAFKEAAGDTLIFLGYESNNDWRLQGRKQ